MFNSSIDIITHDTLAIIQKGGYELDGKAVALSLNHQDLSFAKVYNEDDLIDCVHNLNIAPKAQTSKIVVDNLDSFTSAKVNGEGSTCVLNFANAYNAGGGFLDGANAQEEMLCRCSTLYASLSSKEAEAVYEYNNVKRLAGGSDRILFSPIVSVFRNVSCCLLDEPYTVSVLTSAAPNLYFDGRGLLNDDNALKNVMLRKIKNLVAVSYDNGVDTLILGAWGCGVFGHDPQKTAEYFRHVLVDDGYMNSFKKIVFSIYSPRCSGQNYLAFKKVFSDFE